MGTFYGTPWIYCQAPVQVQSSSSPSQISLKKTEENKRYQSPGLVAKRLKSLYHHPTENFSGMNISLNHHYGHKDDPVIGGGGWPVGLKCQTQSQSLSSGLWIWDLGLRTWTWAWQLIDTYSRLCSVLWFWYCISVFVTIRHLHSITPL